MNKKVFFDFIDAINAANMVALAALMSDDHVFIDSQNNRVEGKDAMKDGWEGYFQLFSDYHIEVNEIIADDSNVYAFGYASGTYLGNSDNFWKIPAAWKAIVEGGKIRQWQVYADNSVVIEIVKRNLA
jgi:ketosteroid isomerase-like protein